MGRWAHEAAAVDPVDERLYITQDHPTGLLYRYTPIAYPDLSAGLLEAAIVAPDNTVRWAEVPDPSGAAAPTREQVPDATFFAGGEGIWYHEGFVYFCTKFDHVVHAIDLRSQVYSEVYRAVPDDVEEGTSPLFGVDNITVDDGSGDLFIAEDGGQEQGEITGPAFNPRRDRLYFSSQRGPTIKTLPEINPAIETGPATGGITYEISGPFRGFEQVETTTTTAAPGTTAAPATEPPATEPPATTIQSPTTTLAQVAASGDESGGGGDGIGVAAVAAAGGALLYFRNRGSADDAGGGDASADGDAAT